MLASPKWPVYGQLYYPDRALDHMKEVTRPDGRYMPVFLYTATKHLLIDNCICHKITTVDMVFMGC